MSQNGVAIKMKATKKATVTAERTVSVKKLMRKMESAAIATADDVKVMKRMAVIENANETAAVTVTRNAIVIGTESERRRERRNGKKSVSENASANGIVTEIETTNVTVKDEDTTGEMRVMSTKASLESRITTTTTTITMNTPIVGRLGIGSASSR